MLRQILSFLLIVSISIIGMAIQPESAQAFVKENGSFTATNACPATQSIRNQTNPGDIAVTLNTTYELLGKNKPEATHYQIRIDGAQPPARWVSVSCGTIKSDVIANNGGEDYVLAASWQPGFCETKPNKTECKSQTADRFDATNFSIHGLWPKPVYCNVSSNIERVDKSKQWLNLPELNLSAETRRELQTKMPGYQSGLHRHEWYKHGTCYSETPEEYYRETISLLDQLNASQVRTLLARNLEKDITDDQVAQAFDTEYGAGSKVLMSCKRVNGENLIQELWINLRGEIDENTNIADLLLAAPDAKAGCQLGQVDSVDERTADERQPVTLNRLDDGRLQILIDMEQL